MDDDDAVLAFAGRVLGREGNEVYRAERPASSLDVPTRMVEGAMAE